MSFPTRIRLGDGVYVLVARCRTQAEAQRRAQAEGLTWTKFPGLGHVVVAATDPDTGLALRSGASREVGAADEIPI